VFSSAAVSESAISGSGAAVTGFERSPPANVVLATFTHGTGLDPVGDFSATVDWCDGTTSTATVSESGGTYTVTGSHTYLDERTYPITINVADEAATATFTTSAQIAEELLPDGTRGTPNQRFVFEVYRDLLRRPVDAAGLRFWGDALDQGLSRAQLVAAVENSPEYLRNVVESLYAQ